MCTLSDYRTDEEFRSQLLCILNIGEHKCIQTEQSNEAVELLFAANLKFSHLAISFFM